MNDFPELTDMIMCYGEARGNGREALRIYQERFPGRHHPYHSMFARLYRRLRETGSLCRQTVAGGRRDVRTPAFEQEVLNRIANDRATSTRAIAHRMATSHSSVWRVIRDEHLHAYHLQRMQGLQPVDFAPRLQFAQWFLQQHVAAPVFPAQVLFTDEAFFSRDGYFNSRNSHIWDVENPHAVFVQSHQQQFSVNVWARIVGDHLLGPVLLPPRLNGENYLDVLQNSLPLLLEDVPLALRRDIWFQHDGAPPHFSHFVQAHLNHAFGPRWIGRGGPIAWPARSPDLTPLDFFLWGHVKSIVYVTPVRDRDELLVRIHAAFEQIRNTPHILERVRQSMLRRCQTCLEVGGGHFEQLL